MKDRLVWVTRIVSKNFVDDFVAGIKNILKLKTL